MRLPQCALELLRRSIRRVLPSLRKKGARRQGVVQIESVCSPRVPVQDPAIAVHSEG